MLRVTSYAIMLIFLLTNIANAQIGASFSYQLVDSDKVENWSGETPQSTFNAGLFYRLTPLTNRIEFHPSINYAITQTDNFELANASLKLPIALYPLDWEGDCDCPTFNKKGEFFKKGFFFEVIPSLNYLKWQNTPLDEDNLTWGVGVGAGIDIGINKYLTVSPHLRYHFHPHTELSTIDINSERNQDSWFILDAGIYLLYHIRG